jgi:hypothetical protein
MRRWMKTLPATSRKESRHNGSHGIRHPGISPRSQHPDHGRASETEIGSSHRNRNIRSTISKGKGLSFSCPSSPRLTFKQHRLKGSFIASLAPRARYTRFRQFHLWNSTRRRKASKRVRVFLSPLRSAKAGEVCQLLNAGGNSLSHVPGDDGLSCSMCLIAASN